MSLFESYSARSCLAFSQKKLSCAGLDSCGKLAVIVVRRKGCPVGRIVGKSKGCPCCKLVGNPASRKCGERLRVRRVIDLFLEKDELNA